MNRISFVITGLLLLLVGINAPSYAKQQQDNKDKQQQQHGQQQHPQQQQQDQNRQQQQRAQQQQQGQNQQQQQRAQQQQQDQNKQQRAQQQPRGQNQQQQQRAQQQQQDQNRQQQQRQQQINRPSQQGQRVQQGQQQVVWQQHRARSWQSEHRTWQQRGGYNGYRIPDDRFRGYFGPSHGFRIYSFPLVVFGGYPTFQYGGFWFSIVDPWPEYWSDNWYDNDDVYIDYSGDGYYMYNRRYPRDRIAISVFLN
jgi:hypothetical protein